jgi:hypothetical protein
LDANLKVIAEMTVQRRHVTDQTYERIRLQRVNLDNCSATRCTFRDIELLECRLWSCTLRNPVLDTVAVRDLRTTIIDAPGKRAPFFVFGGTARHVVLQGRLGSLIWNPPHEWLGKPWPPNEMRRIRNYYEKLDWAIDISESQFQSVPAFRFGPPGELVRRDASTQPLVRRERALTVDWKSLGGQIGVWGVLFEDLVEREWPDSIVLVPAARGRKNREELEGIEVLRSIGLAE